MAGPDPVEIMIEAAIAAGTVILEAYDRPARPRIKADGSPVTDTDALAEAVILEHLAPLGLPVLAEERMAAGDVPELGPRHFVVDALDGTKEFLKRNGEFTVNIALVEDGYPSLGVVLAPVAGLLYAGTRLGAFRMPVEAGSAGARIPIATDTSGALHVVASRSHGHDALQTLCEAMQTGSDLSVGSSLKFCMLAEGRARLYPRFTPTCEWDTAAGQAVLEAAGGVVLGLDGHRLRYGKRRSGFLNGWFVAASDAALGAKAAALMRTISP